MSNRIRVALEDADDYLRRERCLDDAEILFDLNQQVESDPFVIFVDVNFLQGTLNQKGKGVGYGDLIAHIKEAIEQHEDSGAITAPLANVKVKRVPA